MPPHPLAFLQNSFPDSSTDDVTLRDETSSKDGQNLRQNNEGSRRRNVVFINHEAGSESLLLLHVLGRAIGIQVICGTTQAASGTGTKLNGHIFYDEPAEEFNFNNRIWFFSFAWFYVSRGEWFSVLSWQKPRKLKIR